MDYKKFGFDATRLQKRETLLNENINIYPYSFENCEKISVAIKKVADLEKEGQELNIDTTLAGRVWAVRDMGKSIFADIKDDSGKIQIYLNQKMLDEKTWLQVKNLDLGDIIGITGHIFRTKMGELSVKVQTLSLLAKTVVSIPIGKETDDKVFYRSSDPETKYRERYLHWILDNTDREKIKKRSQIISAIRKRMESEGFLEVSTPSIEFIYGGAEARPFKTSIWALDHKEAFLRISPELYLKRFIVAGFDKVFTICQNFRNEGIDATHNPEFTMMEWYEAYTDYNVQMKRFENLVADVCKEICGSTKINYQDVELDFTPPWRRLSMLDALKEFAGINATSMTIDELKNLLNEHKIEYTEPLTWGFAVVQLFDALCEEHLIQPTFIMDHPVDISPLTKVKRGDDRLVERFEPYAYKMELGNSYSELTDPIIQLERFIQQRKNQTGKNDKDHDWEDNPMDLDFIKAVGCGMPPTGGVGFGIERIIMLFTNTPIMRDIIPFPMVKPKYQE